MKGLGQVWIPDASAVALHGIMYGLGLLGPCCLGLLGEYRHRAQEPHSPTKSRKDDSH